MKSQNTTITGTIAQLCFSSSWGGLEIAAYDWSQRFQKRTGNSICICKKGSPLEEHLQNNDMKYYGLFPENRYFDPPAVREIRKILHQENVTFLFVHSSRDLWLATLATRVHQTRVFFFNRMLNSTIMKKDLFHRLIYNKVEQVIVLSELAQKFFAHTTPVAPERIHIVPDAVDPEKHPVDSGARMRIRQKYNISDDGFLVLSVGRIDPGKGLQELIEGIILLLDQGLNLFLVIVGGRTINEHEDYEVRLQHLVSVAKKNNRIIFAGYQDNPGPFYQAADLFIMPSYYETFGLVLLEAMRFAVPVVATNTGAPPEILQNGKAGFLIAPRSSLTIASAIEKLYRDPALRHRLAQAGYQRVQSTYFSEIIIDQVIQLMQASLIRHQPLAKSFSRTLMDLLTLSTHI